MRFTPYLTYIRYNGMYLRPKVMSAKQKQAFRRAPVSVQTGNDPNYADYIAPQFQTISPAKCPNVNLVYQCRSVRSLRWGLPSHCEYGSHIVSVVNRVQHLSPPLSLSHTPTPTHTHTHTHTMNQVKEFFIICTHYITLFHYLCLSLSLSLTD